MNAEKTEVATEICRSELRSLSDSEIDTVAGGSGDDIDSSGPELNDRRGIRIDRVYRK